MTYTEALTQVRPKEANFIEGPILKPLIRFLLPVLAALMIQFLYGAVDLLIVGQFSETASVSGVSMGSQITMTFTSIAANLAAGCTILIGHLLGEQNKKDPGKVIGTSIIFFTGVALVITAVLIALAGPILNLLQTPAEAMQEGIVYTRICGAGMIFIVAYNMIGSVFRGIGDSATPLITVSIACVVNICGDLLLVAGFGLGAAGAAIATVAAQAVSVLISVLLVKRKGLPFEFHSGNIRFHKAFTLRIVKLGAPLAIQDIAVSVSFLIVSALVNTMGLAASAGVGVGGKLINIMLIIPIAFAQSLSAFVAHNIGASRLDRAQKALKYGILLSLAVSVIMFFLAFFHGEWFTPIFTKDPEVIRQGALYLKGFAPDAFATSLLFCFIGFFNGCGKMMVTLWQGVLGVVVRIIMSLIFINMAGVTIFHMGLATPISSFCQDILCGIYLFLVLRKLKTKPERFL